MGILRCGMDFYERGSSQFAVRVRKRSVSRLGFGIVIALLLFSTVKAYQIQGSLSAEALNIYHRHIKQDDIFYRLRRDLWIGANASRDFLLNPFLDKAATFDAQLREVRVTSGQLLAELDHLGAPSQPTLELQTRIQEFWNLLAQVPTATEHLNNVERYRFIQTEIVLRRNSVGALVRELAEVNQDALKASELEFSKTKGTAARRLLIILGLCVTLALAVVGFSLSHSETLERQTARQYEDLERAKVELQQLAARLMEIQEEERTRLSRELHDEIGQALTIIRLELSRAESFSGNVTADVRYRWARTRELAERTIQTIRDISLLLRPALLDDLGLGPALEWHAEVFTRRTGVPCDLVQHGLSELLPNSVKTCVYRVVQESLHNCEKYASASHVDIVIHQVLRLLTVTIEDNGCGFEVASKDTRGGLSARFGLLGMRERAAALGGTLDLDSAPGRGTRIMFSLPIEETECSAHRSDSRVKVDAG